MRTELSHQYPESEAWRELASCRNTDPDLFFPIGNSGPAIEAIEAAKLVCSDCVVRIDCLNFALEKNIDHGIWGGLSEEERRKYRRKWITARRLQGSS